MRTPSTSSRSLGALPSKTEAVCEALLDMAADAGPEGKLPTVRALCADLKVSRATLDRALGRLEGRGVIVRRHGRGIYATGAHAVKVIALLFGLDPFTASSSDHCRLFIDRCRAVCQQRGYQVQCFLDPPWSRDGRRDLQRLKEGIAAGQVVGIVAPALSNDAQGQWVRRQPVPSLVDANQTGTGVVVNLGRLVTLGVEALQARGCRRIGLADHRDRVHDQVYDAQLGRFTRAMSMAGLPIDPTRFCRLVRDREEPLTVDFQGVEEQAYHLMKDLLAQWSVDQRPDGMLVLDDMIARGLIAAMHSHGLRPGRDIHLATHANRGSSALLGYERDLIRLELDVAARAEKTMDLIITLAEGREPAHRLIALDVELRLPGEADQDQTRTPRGESSREATEDSQTVKIAGAGASSPRAAPPLTGS